MRNRLLFPLLFLIMAPILIHCSQPNASPDRNKEAENWQHIPEVHRCWIQQQNCPGDKANRVYVTASYRYQMNESRERQERILNLRVEKELLGWISVKIETSEEVQQHCRHLARENRRECRQKYTQEVISRIAGCINRDFYQPEKLIDVPELSALFLRIGLPGIKLDQLIAQSASPDALDVNKWGCF